MKLRAIWVRLFRTSKPWATRGRSSVRPRLEALETRAVPAINAWKGPMGGLWSNPGNWSTGMVPGPNDYVTFGGPVGANTDSIDDVPSLSVDRVVMSPDVTANLTIAYGATLTCQNFFQHYGTLTVMGASVTAHGRWYENGNILATGYALLAPTLLTGQGGFFQNAGSIFVSGGGSVTSPGVVIAGGFLQGGTVVVGLPGGGPSATLGVTVAYTLNPSQSLTLSSGTALSYTGMTPMAIEGAVALHGATIAAPAGINLYGTLETDGGLGQPDTIVGDVSNNGTILFGGMFTHTLNLVGNYNQWPTGNLVMRVGGLMPDLLAITGQARLHGTLTVFDLSGFPMPGTISTLITTNWGIVEGAFDTVNPPQDGKFWTWGVVGNNFVLAG
jgi:hypothetical protein